MEHSAKAAHRLLTEVSSSFPNAWKLGEQFRFLRGGKGMPHWPDWCFLPVAAAFSIASEKPQLMAGDWVAKISAAPPPLVL
jgi:hypothetical protein